MRRRDNGCKGAGTLADVEKLDEARYVRLR